jgi:hypothetical protein
VSRRRAPEGKFLGSLWLWQSSWLAPATSPAGSEFRLSLSGSSGALLDLAGSLRCLVGSGGSLCDLIVHAYVPCD